MAQPSETQLPSGFMHWYEPRQPGAENTPVGIHLIGEAALMGEISTANGPMYRTSERVVGDGFVVAGAKQLISMETARAWAAKGWIDDPSLVEDEGKMLDPREEDKAAEAPSEGKADDAAPEAPVESAPDEGAPTAEPEAEAPSEGKAAKKG